MFDNFSIGYDDSILLADLVQLGLTQQDVERAFYSDYHALHVQEIDFFIVGYTGRMMLVINFSLNFDRNQVIISDIAYANGEDIDQKYCRVRRR